MQEPLNILNEYGKKLFVIEGMEYDKPRVSLMVKRPRQVAASLQYVLNQIPDEVLYPYFTKRYKHDINTY